MFWKSALRPLQREGRWGHQKRVRGEPSSGVCRPCAVLPSHHLWRLSAQTSVRPPLFPEPKALHSRFGAPPNSSFCWSESARLVRRRGLKRSEWMLHLAAVWPQLSVRRDGIRRDRTAKHKINGKSIFRKSQKYAGCLTSAASTPGLVLYFILPGYFIARD